MEKKYRLLGEDTVLVNGHTLYRIEALRSFGNVNEGDLGGYIESESNLSHEGDCWVYDRAMVYENSQVTDNACLYGQAEAYGHARVADDVVVADKSRVCDYAWIGENARVSGNARVYDYAVVLGLSLIHI